MGALLMAPCFDVASLVVGPSAWGRELYRAGTLVTAAALLVAPLAVITGLYDRARATAPRSEVRRSVNAHALTMAFAVTMAGTGLLLRVTIESDARQAPVILAGLSIVVAVVTAIGAALGGSLVYDYGFNVEPADDLPQWHGSPRENRPSEGDAPSSRARGAPRDH